MPVIGVTGGIGAGKSEILQYMASHYDAVVVQADRIGHLLMQPGGVCYQPVIKLLGTSIIKADQLLDRSKIAAIVYADKRQLLQLNEIIHPAVKTYIKKKIEQQRACGTRYFLIEAALLLEDHYDQICDEIWYIYAKEEIRRDRLKKSRGYSDSKIDQILASQLTEEEFRQRCDVTLNNSDTLEETIKQIELRMRKL